MARVAFMRTSMMLLVVSVCAMMIISSGAEAATAKAKLLPPFTTIVQKGMACGVCRIALHSALRVSHHGMLNLQEHHLDLTEDVLLDVLENLCNPFHEVGEWVRSLVLKNSSDEQGNVGLELGLLQKPLRCKRTCSTTAHICEELMESSTMDSLTSLILHASKKFKDLASKELYEELYHKTCEKANICRNLQEHGAKLAKAINKKPSLLAEIVADREEEIDAKEMEMERTVSSMREEGNEADVYSREEMKVFLDALARGDRERLIELDPNVADLSDDEFNDLRDAILRQEGLQERIARDEQQATEAPVAPADDGEDFDAL